jgi:hypothetical protein
MDRYSAELRVLHKGLTNWLLQESAAMLTVVMKKRNLSRVIEKCCHTFEVRVGK